MDICISALLLNIREMYLNINKLFLKWLSINFYKNVLMCLRGGDIALFIDKSLKFYNSVFLFVGDFY